MSDGAAASTPDTMATSTIRSTADLLAGLELAPDGASAWTGPGLGMPRADWVFGGLLAGQALVAALRTAPGMVPRSVSSRFLRRAAVGTPVRHEVATLADSTSFADRRVVVSQGGEPVAVVSVLAHVPDETDLEHALAPDSLPDVPGDEDRVFRGAGFDVVDLTDPPIHAPDEAPPHQRHWIRAPGTPPGDVAVNAAMVVAGSDLSVVGAAWRPIPGRSIVQVGTVVSYGLTFTLWFHRPAHLDDWHLLDATSPVAAGGRSLALASWYDAGGGTVAHVALDSVMRVRG